MHILSRIRFPQSADTTALYLQGSSTVDVCDIPVATLQAGEMLSTNTYFNSFYEPFYANYTQLDAVYYCLNLAGDFTVSLYRQINGDRTLLSTQAFVDCTITDPIQIPLPNLSASDTKGRIYFEITCLSDAGQFAGGVLATDRPPSRDVSLAIVSCTFKKEAFIKKTVGAIMQDDNLRDKSLSMFVVDNGQTLQASDFPDQRVQLIPNLNLGGSGGFTRGLMEALKDSSYSHILLMDDDVELDSEVIYKLITLYEYAESEVAVAGSMLDLYRKYELYEAGALYGRDRCRNEYEPFEVAPLKAELDLSDPNALDRLLNDEPVDFGAWWFFAFPRSFVDEIGLPMPFFIKGDDIEFSLRITQQLRGKIVAFPAIAVWHEPFYAKFPVWDNYYYFRNFLITHAVYGTLDYVGVVKSISMRVIYMLMFFDYNSASMLVKAFEDFAKGPEFFKSIDPVALHADIVALSKSHKNQTIEPNYTPPTTTGHVPNASLLRKTASLLTLNGHLLPKFLIRDEDTLIWIAPGYPGQRSRGFAKRRVSLFKQKISSLYQYELNQADGRRIFTRWLRLVLSTRLRWASLAKAWKDSADELISSDFWQDYLRLKQDSQQCQPLETPTRR